jgi:hypothetical protein
LVLSCELAQKFFGFLDVCEGELAGFDQVRHDRLGAPAEQRQQVVNELALGDLAGDSGLEDYALSISMCMLYALSRACDMLRQSAVDGHSKTASMMGGYMDTAEFGACRRETRSFGRRMGLADVRLRALVFVVACALAALGLASCSNQGQGGAKQHASVLLRDGSTVTGTVTASSGREITLAGDDSVTHTVPMAQVKSIEYDDALAPGSAAALVAGQPEGGQSAGGQASSTQAAPSNPAAGGAPSAVRRSKLAKAEAEVAHEHHYHPTQAEIETKTHVLPTGTKVPVRTEETIDSTTAVEDQTFAAEIADDVVDASGDTVVPRGANAQVIIRSATKGNRFHGTSDLVLDLQSISVGGQQYLVSTTDLQQKGKQGFGANKRTATFTGGGAALGAIIGAIAGGGKGAAIGAGAGAGAGAVTQVATKGGAIKVPAETLLTFQLDKAVQIVQAK